MMIRYVKERGFKGEGRDPLLTMGKDYVVLGIVFRPAPYTPQVCVCTDDATEGRTVGVPYSDGGPALFDLGFFYVVDARVPGDWLMTDHGGGHYGLGPREFDGDFWERFHDADPSAENMFEHVVKVLDTFHAQ